VQRQAAIKTKSKGYKRRFTFYVPRLPQSRPVITRQAIELELFKPSEDAGSLVDTIKKIWLVLDFVFLGVTS